MASLVFFVRLFWHIGVHHALGPPAKRVVYAWVLTISIPLPLTAGVALLRVIRSWRPFVGCWLVAAGALAARSLTWFLPDYTWWPLSLVVGFIVCALPPILCGLWLLTRARR
jgi:hypothetical protein